MHECVIFDKNKITYHHPISGLWKCLISLVTSDIVIALPNSSGYGALHTFVSKAVDKPICDGSDDNFDTDYLNYDDQEMTR